AADTLGRPIGISAEQRVVVGRAQETNDTKLLNQLIPEFLSSAFVENARLQVPFDVNVQEARYAADGHCRTIGLLDRAQIGKVGPLEGFLGIAGGLRYIAAV